MKLRVLTRSEEKELIKQIDEIDKDGVVLGEGIYGKCFKVKIGYTYYA